jgi:hypothetical protein
MFRGFDREIHLKAGKASGNKKRGGGKGKTYIKENNRHQHRVVMERIIGRPLKSREVVHHKDGNKRNNSPDNLELLPSRAEHNKIHGFCVGANSWCAKLTDQKVKRMRIERASGKSTRSLSEKYGVTIGNVWRICTHKSWKHVI